MKPLILFFSLLLACGSCKNKMQGPEEPPTPLDIPITGTWELVGDITRYCNKEKPEVFTPASKLQVFSITFHDDLSYEQTFSSLMDILCNGTGIYSLSVRKENDGTVSKILKMTEDYCIDGHTRVYTDEYDIVRAPNGDINLQLSSYPIDCPFDDYFVSVYKKL